MLGLTRIKSYEKGLLFHYGDFDRLLEPGKHRLWSRLWSITRRRIDVVSTLATKFEHRILDVLIKNRALRDALTIVELTDQDQIIIPIYILGKSEKRQIGYPHRVEDAIQMIAFMLYGAGVKSAGGALVPLTIEIGPGIFDMAMARYRPHQAGQGQARLPIEFRLVALGFDQRIDHHGQFLGGIFLIVAGAAFGDKE